MKHRSERAVLCSTGWLTFWGDKMANTSLLDFVSALEDVLDFANGTGSVNFYMGVRPPFSLLPMDNAGCRMICGLPSAADLAGS